MSFSVDRVYTEARENIKLVRDQIEELKLVLAKHEEELQRWIAIADAAAPKQE